MISYNIPLYTIVQYAYLGLRESFLYYISAMPGFIFIRKYAQLRHGRGSRKSSDHPYTNPSHVQTYKNADGMQLEMPVRGPPNSDLFHCAEEYLLHQPCQPRCSTSHHRPLSCTALPFHVQCWVELHMIVQKGQEKENRFMWQLTVARWLTIWFSHLVVTTSVRPKSNAVTAVSDKNVHPIMRSEYCYPLILVEYLIFSIKLLQSWVLGTHAKVTTHIFMGHTLNPNTVDHTLNKRLLQNSYSETSAVSSPENLTHLLVPVTTNIGVSTPQSSEFIARLH